MTKKMIFSDRKHSDLLIKNAPDVFKTLNTHSRDGVDDWFVVNTIASRVLAKELLPLIPKHGRWACCRDLMVPLDKQKHPKALLIYILQLEEIRSTESTDVAHVMNKSQGKGKLISSVLSLLNIGASDSPKTTEEVMIMMGSL